MKKVVGFVLNICFAGMAGMILCEGCNQLYKAGNLVSLDYPIETSLRSALIQEYFDTLIMKRGYNVPAKWLHENKLVELDSINHKRVYFRSNPQEMYLISFGGMLMLTDVYSPRLRPDEGYVGQRKFMPKEEEERVLQRFKREILDTIEAMAKRYGLPDSVIYK